MMTENSSPTTEQTSSTPDVSSSLPQGSTQSASASDATSTEGNVASSTPEIQADGTLAPVVPAYTPNHKFKAVGKEYEFEEWARGLVKDKDTEDKLRKLFEKSYAYSPMKERFQKREEDFTRKEEYYSTMDKVVGQVQHFMQTNDYDNLFGPSGLNMKFDDIVNWMNKKLEQMQMPPDQRAEFDRQAQIRQQNYMLAQENQYWQGQFGETAVQARTMQLDTTLSRPDVSNFAQQWDQRTGQLGSFRDTVIQEAINYWHASGKQQDLSAEQAISLVMNKYGKIAGFGQQATQQQQNFQPQASGTQSSQQPPQQGGQAPIIPHVAGRSTSPVKKAFKSLEDLKKHAQTL